MSQRTTKPARRVRCVDDLLARTRLNQHGCRLWTYSLDTHGYAHVGFEGKLWTVTRLLWTWLHGPIPPGLQVLHDCDRFYPPGDRTNRACIEPGHLRSGTNAENSRDVALKGRHWVHAPGWVHPRGAAKVTASDVPVIRASDESAVALGARYGLTPSGIVAIRRRQTWKHVP